MARPCSSMRFVAVALLLAATAACGSTTIVERGAGGGATSSTSVGGATTGETTTGQGSAGGQGAGGGAVGGSGVGGATTGSSPGPWRADMWIGQVDHLSLRHHAVDADVCVLITASAPSGGSTFGVSIPEPWALDMISAWDAADGCMDEPFTPEGDSVLATAASGVIDFQVPATSFYPCELDVDIEVTFDAPPPWAPPSLWLLTSQLAVEGACD